jgi:hypothetical protein
MTLGLTQPLTEMNTRNISWEAKAADAQGWQRYQLHVPIVSKSGNLNFLESSGPLQPWTGIALPCFKCNLTKQTKCVQRNTEARSCNLCTGKAVLRIMSVSVALVIKHAMGMLHTVNCGLSGSVVLFHIVSQTAWLKKLFKIKCVVRRSLQLSP